MTENLAQIDGVCHFPNGLQVEVTGDGVHLRDSHGEIVCWVEDEWREDVKSVINALIGAIKYGPGWLRKAIGREVVLPKPKYKLLKEPLDPRAAVDRWGIVSGVVAVDVQELEGQTQEAILRMVVEKLAGSHADLLLYPKARIVGSKGTTLHVSVEGIYRGEG